MAKKRAARGNKEGTKTPIETALVAPREPIYNCMCQEICRNVYPLNLNMSCIHNPPSTLPPFTLAFQRIAQHQSEKWAKLVPGQGAVVRIPKVKAYQYPQAKFHGSGVLVSHRMKSWGEFLGGRSITGNGKSSWP